MTPTACARCGGDLTLVTVHHKNGRDTRWNVCPTCHTAHSADNPGPAHDGRPDLRLVRT